MNPLVLTTIAAMGGVTFLTRAFPFLFFRAGAPPTLAFIVRYLPPLVMSVLLLYVLRGVDWAGPGHGLAEAAGVAITAGLHLALRNPLVSIFGGTGAYMLLSAFVL
jgi:branched-subunit amino acid transport protein AzlD